MSDPLVSQETPKGVCPNCGHSWDDHAPRKMNLPKNAEGDVVVQTSSAFMLTSGFDHYRGQGECRVKRCKCKAFRPNDPSGWEWPAKDDE